EKEELRLLKALSRFESVLRIAAIQLDPYGLTAYLQELAESFHRFYDTHKVLVDDHNLKAARLSLILGCKNTIAFGLRLAGVSAPEKM
ncbi:arginine--tRNA ligase, partial [bacterium]